MKPLLSIVITALFAASAGLAQDTARTSDIPAWDAISAQESKGLNDFLWVARPIVVFADSAADPRFAQQLALLEAGADELQERDVVVLTDTESDAQSALRKALRPRGFMIVLIGKDGGVKLRKASPWTVRELSRAIDKFPSRQQEVRERRQP